MPTPRVILALANHAQTAGWDRAKVLQRAMFKAAAGSGLEMKFAFYGPTTPPGCAAADHERVDHRPRRHGGRHGSGRMHVAAT